MKKSLFFVLFIILMVFMVSGCGEESGNGGDNTNPPTQEVTTPTLDNITTLQGTYEIEFFYTDAVIAKLTNDCSKLAEYVGEGVECSTIEDQRDSEMTGKGTINVANDNVNIITKIQLNGGGFNNALAANMAKKEKYNYTVYNPIPASSIQGNTLNADNKTTGTTGRNAVEKSGSEKDTYKIKVENSIVIIDMLKDTGISLAPTAPVLVRMKKVSDTVEKLDANTPFLTPKLDDGLFVTDVGYNN